MLQTLPFIASHPLNQGGKIAAFSRFARWQISSRLMHSPQIIPFVEDSVLVVERGMTGATGNWYCGLHEHADMAFVLHFLRPDDVMLDIGANVGTYTILAAGGVGARVIAFEPIPDTFTKLMRNCAINGFGDRADCRNVGVGAEAGSLHFTADLDTVNHVVSGAEAARRATVEVPVERVDDAVTGTTPRLAKIDVEGWEAQVLQGMPRLLAEPDLAAIIMETNSSADRYDAYAQDEAEALVREAGFAPYSYDPFARLLIEHPNGTTGSHNTIFVRDFVLAQARVSSAQRFRLVNGQI